MEEIGIMDIVMVIFFIIIPVILFIYAFVDLIKSRFANRHNKLIWAIIILLVPFFGAILYLVIGKRYKKLT
jgi:uncharacterized membrane protein YeiB